MTHRAMGVCARLTATVVVVTMAGCTENPSSPPDGNGTLPPPVPTTAAITEQDLTTRLHIFADDSMQGRASGTVGYQRATNYLIAELRRMGLTPAGGDGGYAQLLPTNNGGAVPLYNVVAILPGSDPALAGQYVALGAHADHIGVRARGVDHDSLRAFNQQAWWMGGAHGSSTPLTAEQRASIRVNIDSLRALRPPRRDSIANGADDDGSGAMALLEIAEAMSRGDRKPRRSVLFVWHVAEELGLWGSHYFTENPTVPRDSIVAQINIDMIGRGAATDLVKGGPDYLEVVGSRRLSTALGDIVDQVAAQPAHALRLDRTMDADGHPERIYCRSDHYNYARWGIPVAFFFTGLHADYHQVTDEPQYIDYPHYTRITRFLNDLTLALADRAERPPVDQPLPDPYGSCVQ